MRNKYSATETESTPAVEVDSKQQPSTVTKKTKTHRVLMVLAQWGEQAALRILDVQATGIREANSLASELLRRLEPAQLEAITVDPHDLGYDFTDPEIFDVWEIRDISRHAWTRAEIESEQFDAVASHVAAQLKKGSEQSEVATGQMKKANATTDIIEKFDTMTAKQHASMKRKLLTLAKSGAARPHAKTLEGFALAQYTTPNPGRCSSKRGVELN
jgi:hypothetical protein